MFKLLPRKDIEVIDINTQEDMEKCLTSTALADEIALQCDLFVDSIELADTAINAEFADIDTSEFIYQFIALMIDPQVGENDLYEGMYQYEIKAEDFQNAINNAYNRFSGTERPLKLNHKTLRVVAIQDLIAVITSLPWFRQFEIDRMKQYQYATKLLLALENIFHYVISVRKEVKWEGEKSEYINVPFVVFDFDIDEFQTLNSQLSIDHFPLIDIPTDWTQTQAGGYIEPLHSKSTKRLGASEQPQQVLDILNTLQHNEYKLASNIDIGDYQQYIYEKQSKKYDDEDAPENAQSIKRVQKDTTSSFSYVVETMSNYSFYFEWQYDFRGRLYSTGYNINLQADKYKKGMIRPMESSFPRDQYTIDTSSFKGL